MFKRILIAAILAMIPTAVFAQASNFVDARGYEYETIAASQTDQVMGTNGAVGDLLARLVCDVNTAATSAVAIQDGTDTAINMLENNVGAGVGVYVIEIGALSRTGSWQITTGAGVTCMAIGRFS